MPELHVFANDVEWVVAESLEDVEPAMKESIGAVYGPEDEIEWWQPNDDFGLTIWMNGEEISDGLIGVPVRKTCRKWADEQGRGFLCSTEY